MIPDDILKLIDSYCQISNHFLIRCAILDARRGPTLRNNWPLYEDERIISRIHTDPVLYNVRRFGGMIPKTTTPQTVVNKREVLRNLDECRNDPGECVIIQQTHKVIWTRLRGESWLGPPWNSVYDPEPVERILNNPRRRPYRPYSSAHFY